MENLSEIYVEKNPRYAYRTLHVVAVIKQPEHQVSRPYAVCVSRGKAVTISLDRLKDPARYTPSFPLEAHNP